MVMNKIHTTLIHGYDYFYVFMYKKQGQESLYHITQLLTNKRLTIVLQDKCLQSNFYLHSTHNLKTI